MEEPFTDKQMKFLNEHFVNREEQQTDFLKDEFRKLEEVKTNTHDVNVILGISRRTGGIQSFFTNLSELKKAVLKELDNDVVEIHINKRKV